LIFRQLIKIVEKHLLEILSSRRGRKCKGVVFVLTAELYLSPVLFNVIITVQYIELNISVKLILKYN